MVNELARPSRADYERLEATLHRCARAADPAALAAENRAGVSDHRARLPGRVAWFEHTNPARGPNVREPLHRIARPRARADRAQTREPARRRPDSPCYLATRPARHASCSGVSRGGGGAAA